MSVFNLGNLEIYNFDTQVKYTDSNALEINSVNGNILIYNFSLNFNGSTKFENFISIKNCGNILMNKSQLNNFVGVNGLEI